MVSEARKALLFMALLVGGGAVGAVLLRSLLASAAGGEAQVVAMLTGSQGERLELLVPGAALPLRTLRHHYDRISVTLEGSRGVATATLDLDGQLGDTSVSSLGAERVPVRFEGGGWSPTEGHAPYLTAVVAALEARRRALEAGDAQTLARLWGAGRTEAEVLAEPLVSRLFALDKRRYAVESWHIRVEPEGAWVNERFRYQGESPQRPFDERGERRLLLRRSGREFFFLAGLM